MPVELLPMEEADLPAYYDIVWQAGQGDFSRAMWPNGYPATTRDWSVANSAEEMRTSPDTHKYMKVIDTDLPADDPFRQIVGIAKWSVYPHDRTAEEMEAAEKEAKEKGPIPAADPAFLKDLFSANGSVKKEAIGNKAHVYLAMLFTHPDRFRRGAGAMHLKWGLDLADELGVPAYLESSTMGRALYERNGFELFKVLPFDLKKWNIRDEKAITCLLRPARTVNGDAV